MAKVSTSYAKVVEHLEEARSVIDGEVDCESPEYRALDELHRAVDELHTVVGLIVRENK